MNIPDRITIGEKEYVIVVTDILKDDLAGGCHPKPTVIMISNDQSKDEALATFFHEILHAIEFEYKVHLGHKKINKLEYALAQVFRQLSASPKRKR